MGCYFPDLIVESAYLYATVSVRLSEREGKRTERDGEGGGG